MNKWKKFYRISLLVGLVSFWQQSSLASADKFEFVVAESLKSANPYLSARLKEEYELGAGLAIREFRSRFPNVAPNIEFRFQFSSDAADKIVDQLVSEQEKGKGLAVVGFAFSNNAALAASAAKGKSLFVATPTASYDSLFQNSNSRSFGVSVSDTAKLICKKLRKLKKKFVMLYPTNFVYAVAHADAIKANCGDLMDQEKAYISSGANYKELVDWLEGAKVQGRNVVFPGYFHEALPILTKLRLSEDYVVFGTSQWAYSREIVGQTFKKPPRFRVFVVSDYVAQESSKAFKKFTSDFKKLLGKEKSREPNQFIAAIYDAVRFTLESIARCGREFQTCIGNSGKFIGVSGSFCIHKGRYYPRYALSRWSGSTFSVEEEIAPRKEYCGGEEKR